MFLESTYQELFKKYNFVGPVTPVGKVTEVSSWWNFGIFRSHFSDIRFWSNFIDCTWLLPEEWQPLQSYTFEELLISTFQKHIVFICTDVSGRSYDGVKMAIFEKVGIWDLLDARRDLGNPRKKRPFLTPKSVFPLQAPIPLQIWAQTVQGARRTVHSKWSHKKGKISKKIVSSDFSISRSHSHVHCSLRWN